MGYQPPGGVRGSVSRSVAKAVLDVTAAGRVIKDEILKDGNVDLAPYFDFWFADSIACAQKLLQFDDEDERDLARCPIDLEKATKEPTAKNQPWPGVDDRHYGARDDRANGAT